jgi:hypothetical protein
MGKSKDKLYIYTEIIDLLVHMPLQKGLVYLVHDTCSKMTNSVFELLNKMSSIYIYRYMSYL